MGIDNVHWRIREQVTCIGDDSRNLYEKESYRLLPTYASLSGTHSHAITFFLLIIVSVFCFCKSSASVG